MLNYKRITMSSNREVVTTDEQLFIIEWIKNNSSQLKLNQANFNQFVDISDCLGTLYTVCQTIRNRIILKENLHRYSSLENVNDFIYNLPPGTKLHYHVDNKYKLDGTFNKFDDLSNNGTYSKMMIRFNVCIQKPEKGGRPIYAGNCIELIERSYIICRSEIDPHTSEFVYGSKSRINISFGFIINKRDLCCFSNRENIVSNTFQIESWRCLWNEHLNDLCTTLPNNKFVSLQQHPNNNDNALEAYVFTVSKFHLKRKGFDKTNYKIEFGITEISKLTTGYDNANHQRPFLSIVSFLSSDNYPIIFLNLDYDAYKYKEILDENSVFVALPDAHTHIVHDGLNIFGTLKPSSDKNIRYLLINIFESDLFKSDALRSYSSGRDIVGGDKSNNLQINLIQNEKSFVKDLFCPNWLEYLLYDDENSYNNKRCRTLINKIVQSADESIKTFVIKLKYNNTFDYLDVVNKLGNAADDIYPFLNTEFTLYPNNRFYQPKLIRNMLSSDICEIILKESISSKNWQSSKYANYYRLVGAAGLPITKNVIFPLLKGWKRFIKNIYDLKLNIYCKKLFVSESINFTEIETKTSSDAINNSTSGRSWICAESSDVVDGVSQTPNSKWSKAIGNDYDNSLLSCALVLSDTCTIKTVGSQTTTLLRGDMFIFNGKSMLPNITNYQGKLYLLVLWINIDL